MKVEQELMRHADIRTTMNVYGKAMDESKREAHRKVVSLVLPMGFEPTTSSMPSRRAPNCATAPPKH